MTEITLTNEEIAEASLELAKNYIHKACATTEKEKIIKSMLIARQSLNKALSSLGFQP